MKSDEVRTLLDPHKTPGYMAMPAKLSAKRLENLTPPLTGRLEITDTDQRGLKFRLTSTGVATWSLQVNVNGRKRRYTIGEYPTIGLSEARKRAAKLRSGALDGHDPIEARRAARRLAESAVTVRTALDSYAELHLRPNLRTAGERRRQLDAALALFMDVPVGGLSRSDLQKIIDDKARSAPFAANRLRAALSAFIGWCWRRGYVESNFALATSRAAREMPRERVPSLSEIQRIWRATDALGDLWGPYFKLLILTAQRRGDVAAMEWSEIDFEQNRWSISGGKTKNAQPHIVHLCPTALAILKDLQSSAAPGGRFVFSTTGKTPISGFGRAKERLDKSSAVDEWRLHDLRTAFATHLAEAGIDESVVDRVLNHVASASSASTVARVYNRADRLQARAFALDAWATFATSTENQAQVISMTMKR